MSKRDDFSYDSFGAFGACLAIAISYTTNQHIGWAILHGLFSWLYVIYCLLGYGR